MRTKKNQRWLWVAIDHETRAVLAFVFGQRKDCVFRKLKALLEPFGITTFYTDDWGTYERNLAGYEHIIGKENTQRIERKNLTFRTRIKRLCRKTICYSKCEIMHDIVVGLYYSQTNKYTSTLKYAILNKGDDYDKAKTHNNRARI